MYKKKGKKVELTKTKAYRFWNNKIEYVCNVVYPKDLQDYKVKEIVDKTFVGKIVDINNIPDNLFGKLGREILYTIKPVKEM